MGLLDVFKRSGAKFPPRPPVSVPADFMQRPTLAPGGEGRVVGEARRQQYLEELACGRNQRGCVVRHFIAELVREPDNPHDSNAVRVDIAGRAVGYIPKEEALDYHDVIASLWQRGLPATCRCTLTGGWSRAGDSGRIGLFLDVGDELRETTGALALLPSGPRVTVTCEEHYTEVIGRILGSADRMTLPIVALAEREANPHKPKHAGPAIAVQISGEDVGYLTPAMAERYLPLVRYFSERGVETTCSGSLKRTAKQIEVRLEMPLPEHLGKLS